MTATPPLAVVPDTIDPAQVELVKALLAPPAAGDLDDEHPLEYGPDGTVTFEVAGVAVRLAPPTLGQFRELVTKAERYRTAEPRKIDANIGDLAQRVRWFHDVIVLLGDAPAPPVDGLPLWCANPRLEFALTAHWMRVPTKAPGSNGAPGAAPDVEAP